ncbi:hypothetical protein ACJJTC_002667 [Scirpophaga incertulas]
MQGALSYLMALRLRQRKMHRECCAVDSAVGKCTQHNMFAIDPNGVDATCNVPNLGQLERGVRGGPAIGGPNAASEMLVAPIGGGLTHAPKRSTLDLRFFVVMTSAMSVHRAHPPFDKTEAQTAPVKPNEGHTLRFNFRLLRSSLLLDLAKLPASTPILI